MFSNAYVWAKVLSRLEDRLDPITVATWFDDAEVVEFNQDNLIICCPEDYRREWITNRFSDHIQDILKENFQSNAKLLVISKEELEARNSKKTASSFSFNPEFTFDNFVVGGSNRFAHSAALAVSRSAGQVYNPLFIYGPAGVGKTHLLYAIATEIKKQNPDANIVYIKGDQFTNELIAAIQSGRNIEFRSKYREADLFLIDDIQFIAGKESTQEEFFHTFNKLYEEHKQIVMTSDRKPSDMLTLEDRLKTRFEWGLLADIQPPDYETRMAIIKNKGNSYGLDLDDEICNYIAVNVTSNVRQLEGTVKKIRAYVDLNGMKLDLPNVSRAIDDMFKNEGSSLPTPSLIISQVCRYYSIDESVLRGTLKNKGTSEARQVAIYLIRKLTNLSLPDIGREFGRDHTTILYAIQKMEANLKGDSGPLQDKVMDITANVNSCL